MIFKRNTYFFNNGYLSNHPVVQDWLSRLTGDAPSSTLLDNLNTMFYSFDAVSATRFDWFHVWKGMETESQRLTPLITTSGNNITSNGLVSFSADGFTGDGVTGYLDTGYNAPTHAVYYALNDACFGGWMNNVTDGAKALLGCHFKSDLIPRLGGQHYIVLNNQNVGWVNGNTNAIEGFFSANRDNALNIDTFAGNSAILTDAAQGSTSIPDDNFYVGACKNGAGIVYPSDGLIKCAFIGGSMDQLAIQGVLNTYINA